MSLGFHITGRIDEPDELVEKAKAIAKEHGYGIAAGEEGLCIRLCPMGDLEVVWSEDEQEPGRLLVEADCQTTPAGPGFHKAALEAAEQLGIDVTEIDDETDYVNHRNFEKMQEEHFFPWLKTLVQICRKTFSEKDYSQISLCWDTNLYQPENVARTAVTPLGRYSLENMEKILDKQGIEALAERFFLWKNIEQDALFFRNRALYALWVQCYFVPSSRSENDKRINESILEDLERAYRMEPELPFPYQEYREVCKLAGRKPVMAKAGTEYISAFPIGYRKGTVTLLIANLHFCLPGSYQYEWEEYEDGSGVHLWCDDSVNSPIWRMSIYHTNGPQAPFSENNGRLQELAEEDISNGRIRYGWEQYGKKKDIYYVMECEVIAGDFYYLITVTYTKKEEKEGIIALLRRMAAVQN